MVLVRLAHILNAPLRRNRVRDRRRLTRERQYCLAHLAPWNRPDARLYSCCSIQVPFLAAGEFLHDHLVPIVIKKIEPEERAAFFLWRAVVRSREESPRRVLDDRHLLERYEFRLPAIAVVPAGQWDQAVAALANGKLADELPGSFAGDVRVDEVHREAGPVAERFAELREGLCPHRAQPAVE